MLSEGTTEIISQMECLQKMANLTTWLTLKDDLQGLRDDAMITKPTTTCLTHLMNRANIHHRKHYMSTT